MNVTQSDNHSPAIGHVVAQSFGLLAEHRRANPLGRLLAVLTLATIVASDGQAEHGVDASGVAVMRQGLRSSSPARSDGATAFASRNQLFGGEPSWSVSPYLANGADPLTRNNIGNIHSQNGSQADTNSTNGMAISVLGDMTANVRVLCNATFSGAGAARTMVVNSISVGDGLLLSGAGTAQRLRIRYVGQSASAREIWITAQTLGSAGSTGTYSVSASVSGDFTNGTFDIAALSPLTSADGGPAVGIVDVSGRKYYRARIAFDDQNAAGQIGRKVLFRIGDSGAAPADGQNAQAVMGQTVVYAYSLRIPAATRNVFVPINTYPWLIWQHHNGGTGPNVSLYLVTRFYSDGGVLGPGIGPSILMKMFPAAWANQVRVVDNYPADTWLHFVKRVTFGVAQWVTGKVYGPDEYVHNAGNIYKRATGGANEQTSGVTAPVHGSGSVSDGTCTWAYIMATPATNVQPRTQLWTEINGVRTAAADYTGATARTNVVPDAGSLISSYWGWYGSSFGDAPNNLNWASGDVLESHWSGMTVASDVISRQAVQAVNLDQWFSVLRDRVPQ